MDSSDPFFRLCCLAAQGADPATILKMAQPLQHNPQLREIATILLTNMGIEQNNDLNESGNASTAKKLSNLDDILVEKKKELDTLAQQYDDLHCRLSQTNALSDRRMLVDAVETIIGGIISYLECHEPGESLGEIADEAKDDVSNFSKIKEGFSSGDKISQTTLNGDIIEESSESLLFRYYNLVVTLKNNLEIQNAAQLEIDDLLDHFFPSDSDSVFIRHNIMLQLECAKMLAESVVLRKRVEIVEVLLL